MPEINRNTINPTWMSAIQGSFVFFTVFSVWCGVYSLFPLPFWLFGYWITDPVLWYIITHLSFLIAAILGLVGDLWVKRWDGPALQHVRSIYYNMHLHYGFLSIGFLFMEPFYGFLSLILLYKSIIIEDIFASMGQSNPNYSITRFKKAIFFLGSVYELYFLLPFFLHCITNERIVVFCVYVNYLRARYITSEDFRHFVISLKRCCRTFLYHPFVPRIVRCCI